MTLDQTAEVIIEWAVYRGIIPNGNTMTQAIKTLEEVQELLYAIDTKDLNEIVDAYGDIFITIVIGAYLNGTQLDYCAEKAYRVIENRKGFLTPQGEFIKESE